jgi:molecular chaperone GrpE
MNGKILDLHYLLMINNMLKKKKTEATETSENLETDIINDGDQLNEQDEPQELAEETISAEDKLKEELALANDKYLRLYAEFDNFRRRTQKERSELLQTAGKDVIVSLLPILDDFERAEKAMETSKDIDAVKQGVALVQSKLNNLLSQKGLKPMQSIGTEFDPDLHEAITNIPAPTDDLKGKVLDEMEKGYTLNDNVIRFAKVIVGA